MFQSIKTMKTIQWLPTEILLRIFLLLSCKDILTIKYVCKQWSTITADSFTIKNITNRLNKSFSRQEWPSIADTSDAVIMMKMGHLPSGTLNKYFDQLHFWTKWLIPFTPIPTIAELRFIATIITTNSRKAGPNKTACQLPSYIYKLTLDHSTANGVEVPYTELVTLLKATTGGVLLINVQVRKINIHLFTNVSD